MYLTVTDVARRLGITDSQVRKLCRQGRLGTRVGPIWIIGDEELDTFVRRPRGRPKKQPEPPK
jgi:excisionase family DNA binding protein